MPRPAGNVARCTAYEAAGGWGPTAAGVDGAIPNRNVWVANNLVLNPTFASVRWRLRLRLRLRTIEAG